MLSHIRQYCRHDGSTFLFYSFSTASISNEVDLDALIAAGGESAQETDNDELLARMLQLEYDKQYDQELSTQEKHYNKDQKGT